MKVPEAYYFKLIEGGKWTTPQHKKTGLLKENTFEEKPTYYIFKKFMNK